MGGQSLSVVDCERDLGVHHSGSFKSLIEKVKRRATRMIGSYNILSYEERLKRLHLTTMETRRLRGDLIEVFKLIKGFKNVNYNDFFTIFTDNRRGNSLKLFKEHFFTNLGKFSLSIELSLLTSGI